MRSEIEQLEIDSTITKMNAKSAINENNRPSINQSINQSFVYPSNTFLKRRKKSTTRIVKTK